MVFAILLATLVLFVWGRWRYDLVALASLLAVYLAGLVPAGQVFSGFAHPAVVTVAAVLVLSRGLLNAGVVDVLARRLARVSTRPEVQVAALTGIVTVSSGFMNNVGALALLMPVAVWMSRQAGRSPAFLLMPMAFGSLLGGLTTLIGTPPNLIIAGYRAEVTGTPFGVFDFTPVGAGVALAGLALIALAGWRWVPERPGQVPAGEVFHLEDYITEMKVTEGSRAVGRQLRELTEQVERERELTVLGLVRGDLHVPSASSSERVQAGDTLIVEADLEEIRYLMDTLGLELAAGGQALRAAAAAGEIEVAEAVIATDSPMVGESAVSLRLRRNFGVNLLAVGRQGQRISGRLAGIRFAAGDIVLLQGSPAALREALSSLKCLPLASRGLRLDRPARVGTAAGVFAVAIAASALGALPVQVAFPAAALAMVLVGLVPLGEVYASIDWPIIVLLGSMFPLGHALESTGGAQLVATLLLQLGGSLPPTAGLTLLLVGTMLLSNVVNNAAAALLAAPIAIGLSQGLGLSADPFLMAVAVGASCAFLTPVGHQSNALVMAPGGYRFGDYWRLGLPLSLLVAAVAVLLIPVFWPF